MEDYKKKYEDALSRAREMCAMPTDKATMEYVFPELKESADEKVRKQLLDFVHRNALTSYSDRDKWVAYLEKLKDFDKQLEDAYKNSDEVQYKRGYDDGYLEGIVNAKKEFEKSKPTVIDIDKMVSKYANTKESTTNGLPVNCQIRAYRKGINDALNLLLDIEKPITIGKRQLTGKAKELYDNLDTESLAETKKKMLAEKSKWTEEDEEMFEEYKLGIQDLMKDAYFEKFCNWIFALKQRLQ